MFSGKSEELLRRVRLAKHAKQEVALFAPHMDQRYGAGMVASHNRLTLPAQVIHSAEEMLALVLPSTQVVALDEGQFVPGELTAVCEALASHGKRVIVAGLDQDYRGKPFEQMAALLPIAEFVTKVHAICVVCGNPANRTQRIGGGNSRLEVGGAATYEARCRRCHSIP